MALPPRRPELIDEITGLEIPRPVMFASDIVKATAAAAKVARGVLIGSSRISQLVLWRHTGIWFAYHTTWRSTPELGRVFSRDHSSVFHAVNATEQRLANWPDEIREMIAAIASALKGLPVAAPVATNTQPAVRPRPGADSKPAKPSLADSVRAEVGSRRWFGANDAQFRRAFAAAYPERVRTSQREDA